MKIIIDRKEGKFFVVEDSSGNIFSVPEELFPEAKEGMAFDITRDVNFEKGRVKKIDSLFESLKKK
jgi:hypothetical protein